ncbi:MAG: glycine cleavage system aminomethyltransferase GcvT [Erysipelothrix sp.]|jgi:aminomethyltransferase|nr:glycine cleavage system aminomethyltransferase GcvT [Erysipelothrix sp.]
MKTTALKPWHEENHAKMIDFYDTLLPVHYEHGIILEHEAVRTQAGIFDVSHMGQLFFKGERALNQARQVLSMDIDVLNINQVKYGFVLRSDGTMVDDVLCMKTCPDEILIIVNGANKDKVVNYLHEVFKDDSLVEDESDLYSVIAFQGPLTQTLIQNLISEPLDYYTFRHGTFNGFEMFISRTGYTGEHGYEFIMANKDAINLWTYLLSLSDKVMPCGLGARDSLRLEAGMPLYGHELNDHLTPLDVGLGMFMPKTRRHLFGLEDYVPHTKRIGFVLNEKVIPREGYEITQNNQVVGVVSSGTFSPSLKRGIAMALIKADCDLNTDFECVIRSKPYRLELVKLPFIKK